MLEMNSEGDVAHHGLDKPFTHEGKRYGAQFNRNHGSIDPPELSRPDRWSSFPDLRENFPRPGGVDKKLEQVLVQKIILRSPGKAGRLFVCKHDVSVLGKDENRL